jgi:hypothetical protein
MKGGKIVPDYFLTALFTNIEPGRGKTLRVFLNPEGFNATE